MASADNLARLNSIHYITNKHGTGKKAQQKINKRLEGTDYELQKLNRGVASFKNKKDDHIAVSVKGTDIKSTSDLLSDVKLGLGFSGHDKQFKSRQKQIKKIYKDNPDVDKYLSGHSLGGSIVTSALVNSKSIRDNTKKAHVYNPGYTPAFHDELSKNLTKDDKKELNNKITHHHVKGDLISDALNAKRIGKLKKYDEKSINPLTKHSLSTVIDKLDNNEEKV